MSRAPRIPNAQWEKHKPTINNLYISQEKKLDDVIKLMADEHGFQPTKAQYVRKLESWGFKKNSSKEKWEHAAAVFRKRKLEGKETELQMNGKVISTKKLRKELGRYAYLQPPSWAPPIEPGGDLEGVVARTPPSSLSSGFIMPNYLPWFQFQDYLARMFIPRSPPVFQRPASQSLQSPTPPEGQGQTWTKIFETRASPGQFSALLPSHSVTMPGRPGDDTHVQLQRLSQAQPFLQLVQRAIYLSSNNLLNDEETDDFLEWVTESGNIWALKEIINRKESTCQVFADQLLLNAIELENEELVDAILTRDAKPKNGNTIPEDAIATAVCSGNSRIVQLLLDHLTTANTSDSSRQVGQYLNSENTGRRNQFTEAFPLSLAIRYGDITMVRSLLDAGADVNNMDDTAISALYVAVEEERPDMVEILLQAGADVNIPLGQGYGEFEITNDDAIPQSPLQAAARGGMNEIVQRLLQEGADIDGTWFTSIEMLEEHIEDSVLSSPPPGTALEQALRFGNFETAEILLNAGANIEGGCLGSTALQATCGSDRLDRLETARLLLRRGADVNGAAGVWFGRTALQAAAERGDMALVQLLLDEGANTNAPPCDNGGITALQAAARSGNQDIVRMLLEHGADANAPASHRGETALSAAVSHGHFEVAEMLLEAGAFVNEVEDGLTPLCLAITGQRHELFELLMKHNADPNPLGVRYTPLASAVAKNELEMVSILLIAGANPNICSSFHSHLTSGPPLTIALQNQSRRSFPIVQLLVKHGADVNNPSFHLRFPIMLALNLPDRDEAKSTMQLLLDAGADLRLLSKNMSRVFMIDSRWNLVRMLLDRGADINAPMSIKGTLLQLAVQGGNADIVQELISRGADVNTPADPQRIGGTALQLAVRGGYIDIVQELISQGADINAPGGPPWGRTALQLAVEQDNIHIARKLLLCGADVNAPACPQQERTALQLAVRGGYIDIVQELISWGADVNAPAYPKKGRTALQLAVERDNIRIARKLILCGADVSAPPASEAGATALQFAAMNGNIEMAVLLLENQADVNAGRAPVEGRTALEGAAEHGRLDMVHLLLENDQDLETIEERCQDAAKFAEKEEHFYIARLLREWRRS